MKNYCQPPKYLTDFEALNLASIPRARLSGQLGWQGEHGLLGFLWGRTLLHPEYGQQEAVDLVTLPPERWRQDLVAFRGADLGEEQMADAFCTADTLEV